MKCAKWVVIGVMALSLTGVALRAADEQKPADSADKTEKKEEKKASSGGGRLVQPYSKMTTLSDDQKQKISDIHKDFNAQRKELDKKEREQIMALLSDEQKKEVEKLEGDKKSGGSKKADAKSTEKASDAPASEKKE
jgi:Spy/CpxP family protein refolding chaperone